jgi:hypothetical protein
VKDFNQLKLITLWNMVRTYVRKTDFEIAPRKELALLSEEDRTERRQ